MAMILCRICLVDSKRWDIDGKDDETLLTGGKFVNLVGKRVNKKGNN